MHAIAEKSHFGLYNLRTRRYYSDPQSLRLSLCSLFERFCFTLLTSETVAANMQHASRRQEQEIEVERLDSLSLLIGQILRQS